MLTRNKKKLSYLTILSIFLFFGTITEYSYNTQRDDYIAKGKNEARESAFQISSFLEKEINSNLSLTQGMAGYIVSVNGVTQKSIIDSMLAYIYNQGSNIRNIGYAPGNTITNVYPMKGNEKVMGVNYANIPEQWSEIEMATSTKKANNCRTCQSHSRWDSTYLPNSHFL